LPGLVRRIRAAYRRCARVETAKKNGKSVETINPVMLVIAPTIEDAEEIAELLRHSVAGGKYADSVLEVHSKATGERREKMLAALDAVEEPTSAVRIIVSVGMLKDGWDVKNVYVISSLRSSISDVLTEQTLGRGMRLPFGAYTEIEMLDEPALLSALHLVDASSGLASGFWLCE
jgi:type III restriction enzyme